MKYLYLYKRLFDYPIQAYPASFLLSILFFLVTNTSSYSQKQQPIKFSQLSLKEGLSQSVVFQTLQDKEGLLWFGTQDGLNKYDGYKFTVFRNNPKDNKSLSNNTVWSLLEDNDGLIWIGTRGGGLNCFDRRIENFVVYKSNPKDIESISSNFVYSIFEDQQGIIWIGTDGGGLNRFDKKTGKFKVFKNNPLDSNTISNNNVYSITSDDSGNLWIGTLGGGLDKFDTKSQVFTIYKNHPNRNSISNNSIRSIIYDHQGFLWIGTDGGGVNKFDLRTQSFECFKNNPKDPNSISNNYIYSILESDENNLWIATYGGGLNRFNKKTEVFTTYKKDQLKPESLSSDYVMSLFLDKSKTLWIGTYGGGISKYNRFNSKFSVYRYDPIDPTSLSSSAIRSIFIDKLGVLWVGTRGGGLNKYNEITKSFVAYHNDEGDKNSRWNNSVYSIIEDNSGVLWIGTFGGGLNIFDRKTGKYYAYKNDPIDPNSLSNNSIYYLLEDKDGFIWVGTDGGGLNKFDKRTGKFKVYKNDSTDSLSLSNNMVITIHEDHGDKLWIGTRGGGLNIFDKNTKRFVVYKNNPFDDKSLPNNSVLSIVEDDSGTIWIGTDGGGLVRVNDNQNVNNLSFTSFSIDDGLPNNCVYGIVEDKKGTLWLSTNKGLCKFTNGNVNSTTKDVISTRNYDYFDGLPSNEFNTGAYFINKSNQRIYFGTIDGLISFNPDSIEENPYQPSVVITDFQLFNKKVDIIKNQLVAERDLLPSKLVKKNEEYSIPQSITYTKELTLSYSDKVFTFEFAALDFSVPEKNQYSYKMDGFDSDWNSIGTRRYATYTNLSHGEYTFRVNGSNSDGIWNTQGASIKLIILPPFWQTTWFRIMAILAIISSIMFYIKWRERKLKRDKDNLEATVKERTIQLKDANEELNQQNEEISTQRDNLQLYINELQQKNEEIMAQRDKIQIQSRVIEQKNLNITASIAYAESIQQSILPEADKIKSIFPESFVIYKPKDIVSGDFYWLYETDDKVFFSVIDCTGHGVPGALMSVMGFAFLRKALHELNSLTPADILNHLSLEINTTLRKADKDINVKDGMDLALCALHKKSLMLEYSGAHNPVLILRQGEIVKLKPDNHPIGDPFTVLFKGFNNLNFQLRTGDIIYLFTDGLVDQFGGPKDQKFSSKQFERLVLDNSGTTLELQKVIIEESLEQWRIGYNKIFDQTDDITVMGIRI